MVKLVEARKISRDIQATVKEVLLDAAEVANDEYDTVLIITRRKDGGNTYWQGGGMSRADMLWEVGGFREALLSGRIYGDR
jgi:hypothetical protein